MLHDPEVVRAMARAGCRLIYMGSESFDDGLLEDMAKDQRVRDVIRAVEVCREAGVEPEISVLIGGSPRESWASLWRSWRAARRLGTRFVHFSVAQPIPSTRLYEEARARGWFVEGDYRPADNQREVLVDLPRLSRRELALALRLAHAGWHLSPRGLLHHARGLRDGADLRARLDAGRRLLRFLARPGPRSPVPPGRVTPPET